MASDLYYYTHTSVVISYLLTTNLSCNGRGNGTLLFTQGGALGKKGGRGDQSTWSSHHTLIVAPFLEDRSSGEISSGFFPFFLFSIGETITCTYRNMHLSWWRRPGRRGFFFNLQTGPHTDTRCGRDTHGQRTKAGNRFSCFSPLLLIFTKAICKLRKRSLDGEKKWRELS